MLGLVGRVAASGRAGLVGRIGPGRQRVGPALCAAPPGPWQRQRQRQRQRLPRPEPAGFHFHGLRTAEYSTEEQGRPGAEASKEPYDGAAQPAWMHVLTEQLGEANVQALRESNIAKSPSAHPQLGLAGALVVYASHKHPDVTDEFVLAVSIQRMLMTLVAVIDVMSLDEAEYVVMELGFMPKNNKVLFFERMLRYNPEGVLFLVHLRELIGKVKALHLSNPKAKETVISASHALKLVLIPFFGRACLYMDRVALDSDPQLLAVVKEKERVVPIPTQRALERRLRPGRRVFALFGKHMPATEPLAMVHVLLADEVKRTLADVDESETPEDEANTAIFYSISALQPGLAGIMLGSQLIEQVVEHLQETRPDITTFVTLSPMPGFLDWLKRAPVETVESCLGADARKELQLFEPRVRNPKPTRFMTPKALLHQVCGDGRWRNNDRLREALRGPLLKLGAEYVTNAKLVLPSGVTTRYAASQVTNFHIGNGAEVARINFQSKGKGFFLMVNYAYKPENLWQNGLYYRASGTIPVSDDFYEHLE